MAPRGCDIVYCEMRVLLPASAAGAVGDDPTIETPFVAGLIDAVDGADRVWPAGQLLHSVPADRPVLDLHLDGEGPEASFRQLESFLASEGIS